MNLSIIGSGMIVKEFLSFVKEVSGINLVSIVGTQRSEEKLKELTLKNEIKRYNTNYEQELACFDIDTVYIAIPNHLHYEYAKKALLAGKNVICEKPFTMNAGQLEELITISQEKKLILLEAITNQYVDNFYTIKNYLNKIGDVKIIYLNFSQYSSRYDSFKQGIISPVFDKTKGGGALMDLNIYNIHLVVSLFGTPNNVSYVANTKNGLDTSGVLVMEYNDKKAVCIAAKDCSSGNVSTIQGELGVITITGGTNHLNVVSIDTNDDDYTEFTREDHLKHRMYAEFKKFEEVIREKDYVFADKMARHSLEVMKVIDKARDI